MALLGLLAVVLGGGTAVGVAAGVGAALRETPPAPQVSVAAPAVSIAAPPVVVTPIAAPPVAEPPEPPEPPRPQPRATRPFLDGDCVIVPEDAPPRRACAWDHGFPAVSADGKRVAMYHIPDPGQADSHALYIRFLDVRTSHVVRDMLIHDEEEHAALSEAEAPAVRAKLKRRAAAAQRILDAGGYRTLDPLGEVGWDGEQHDHDRLAGVHAEIVEDLVRAVDPATGRVLWQHRFEVPRPRGGNPDDECSGFSFHGAAVWWDPSTRVVLVTQAYAAGGCMCGVYQYQHVKQMR